MSGGTTGELATALGVLLATLLVVASARYLIRRAVAFTRARGGLVDVSRIGAPEAVLCIALATWFAVNLLFTPTSPVRAMSGSQIRGGLLVYGLLILVILVVLRAGGKSPVALFGLNRLPVGEVLRRAVRALAGAYPVLAGCMLLFGWLFPDAPKQEAIRYFIEHPAAGDRLPLILLAVIAAPVAEELMFRGLLYGVGRRYFGAWPGAVVSALLFAAVHHHPTQFAAFALLGLCLTLAYEASGCLLVSMGMHALFNAVSLLILFWQPSAG